LPSPASDPNPTGVLSSAITRIARACIARPRTVVLVALILSAVGLTYLISNFALKTDLDSLISPNVPWRRTDIALQGSFPQLGDDITMVIDGVTPERADHAADALAAKLQARTDLFIAVDTDTRGPFFDKVALLYESLAEVKKDTAALIDAQPLIGPLAADPSLRGFSVAMQTALTGAEQDPRRLLHIQPRLSSILPVWDAAQSGRPAALSWRAVLSGSAVEPSELRRIVQLTPRLDYSNVSPGAAAMAAVRDTAKSLQIDAAHGARVRLTGSTPMAEDELATLKEATGPIAALSLALLMVVLYFAVRSPKVIAAIMATVFAGLVLTSALGILIYGQFNLISIAFMPLFIGLGVDFAVQFAVRYREVVQYEDDIGRALERSAGSVGAGIALAASAVAIGFFAFLPTSYRGVSELGAIAGCGMIIAFLLTVTLLPALLRLLHARSPQQAQAPTARTAPSTAATAFGIAGIAALTLLGFVRLDFDPVSLRSPASESVATYRDLSRNTDTTPNTLDILSPSLSAATALAQTLNRLPQVKQAVTLTDFLATDQSSKLAVISDAQLLLDTTLTPFDVAPAPSDEALVTSLNSASARLRAVAASPGQDADAATIAVRMATLLHQTASASPAVRARVQEAMMHDLPTALDGIRAALTAEPVDLESLPTTLKRSWVAPNGSARISVWPSGNASNPAAIARFVASVRKIIPDVSGTPVTVKEAGMTVLTAFGQAAGLAIFAISLLLLFAMRSVLRAALTLAPVLLTLSLTMGTLVLFRQPVNLENLIALPLILGIGVSFNIYLVSAWRRGSEDGIDGGLARAIFYSALTTATAFSALLLSSHPGTASLGLMLTIALGWTILTSLVFQPALLGALSRRSARSVGPGAFPTRD
jgi:hopanoid biosynthesis associated RND transporter like protein HpnN